jgi:hypothetical protein
MGVAMMIRMTFKVSGCCAENIRLSLQEKPTCRLFRMTPKIVTGDSLTNEWPAGESLTNERPAGESLTNEWPAGESLTNEWPAGESLTNDWPETRRDAPCQPAWVLSHTIWVFRLFSTTKIA